MTAFIPNVLSIAGTDPTGGAGIQADIKAISANGGYAMSAITALVAQNTQGVRDVHYPPVEFLREQLDAVASDVRIDAVKIGMLGTVDIIKTVTRWLAEAQPPVVVLDPVMVATSGDRLLAPAAETALVELAAWADVITPNVPELAVLASASPAEHWHATCSQAYQVSAQLDTVVLAKGGHLGDASVHDALIVGHSVLAEVTHPRQPTPNTHGTGCSLSSALATRYAINGRWETTLAEATDWLFEAIAHSNELTVGHGHGPVHHFGAMWDASLGCSSAEFLQRFERRAPADK